MYYIGLDVHKKTISFCVKNAAGRVHQEGKIGSSRRELDDWIRTLPQPRTMAMEATIFTGWIYDHLLPHAEKGKVDTRSCFGPSPRPRRRTTASMPARSPTACGATSRQSATWPLQLRTGFDLPLRLTARASNGRWPIGWTTSLRAGHRLAAALH